MPSNVLPLHLKQTFLPMIYIFTEGEGDGIRLPFKIFSTLIVNGERFQDIDAQRLDTLPRPSEIS